jgi:tRNA-2-methylthio-N6-dimethylallyladenosine synthase/ribosomal protein S12 methylthiotransferase
MFRCYAVSLGCPKNRVDGERLLGMPGLDLSMTDDPAEADIVFINTCGFIRSAVEESVETIARAIEDVGAARVRPLLVVGGCLIGRYGREVLAAELPEVDLWLDNRELADWPALLARALGLEGAASSGPARMLSTGPAYAWLKVADGCRHACFFCTIPSIRGPYCSVPAAALRDEARMLLDKGVRELNLVAQDVTAWGHDLRPERDVRHLLDVLLPLPGLERLRLLYLYPTGLSEALLAYLRQAGPPFVPYFDVPLQHAHPDVLRRMGRPFASDPGEVLARIRGFFPDCALRTTLIVGFPGETREQFESLYEFAFAARFTHLGVFAYEPEEGTPAALMPDQIAAAVKLERKDAIMRMQAGLSTDWLQSFVGQRLSVLVDAAHPGWPGLHVGRTWFQAPEIDGMVYVSGDGVRPGAVVAADIVESREYDLVALA